MTYPNYKWKWWTLAVLTLSLLVIGFDTTILTVALPVLSGELHASITDLQWIMDSYLLVFSALLLPAGSLGDRFGRKRVLFIGFIIFGVTSLMAGYAQNTGMLIAARALMGIGAAIIMPLTLSILPTVFPPAERGKAIGIWAAGSGIGLLVGPVLGGYLLEHFSWGSVFLINLPIIALVIITGFIFIPESKNPSPPKMDWLGTMLSVSGFTLFVYGLIEGPQQGWLSAESMSCTGAGILLIGAFIWWQRASSQPMLDMKIFRNPRFSWGTVAGCFVMFVLSGVLFFITQYIQVILGNSPLDSGIKLMPLIGAYVVGAIFSSYLVKAWGTKWVVAIGLILLASGLYILSLVDIQYGYSFLAFCLIIQGLGMSLTIAPAMDAVMESLPLDQVGIGSAVNNTMRQVCSTLGVAVMGSIVSSVYKGNLNRNAELPDELVHLANPSISAAHQTAKMLKSPLKEQLAAAADSAFIEGISYALLVGVALVAIGVILTIRFLPSRSKSLDQKS